MFEADGFANETYVGLRVRRETPWEAKTTPLAFETRFFRFPLRMTRFFEAGELVAREALGNEVVFEPLKEKEAEESSINPDFLLDSVRVQTAFL
jgi:hypothetical protein